MNYQVQIRRDGENFILRMMVLNGEDRNCIGGGRVARTPHPSMQMLDRKTQRVCYETFGIIEEDANQRITGSDATRDNYAAEGCTARSGKK